MGEEGQKGKRGRGERGKRGMVRLPPFPSSPFSLGFGYPAATDDFVASIENRRLAGSDSALWFGKNNSHAVVFERSDRGWRRLVTIAHANLGAHGCVRFFQRDPVNTHGSEFTTQQIVLLANYDSVFCGVDVNDIER